MSDKKQKTKNTPKPVGDKKQSKKQVKHVFEVHTMQGDNEAKRSQPQLKNEKTMAATTGVAKKNKTNTASSMPKPPQKNKQNSAENPFLTEKTNQSGVKNKKGSFAPGKTKEPVEKINYTTDDIVSKDKKKSKPKKQKKSAGIIVVILITILLFGAVGFAVYFFLFNKTTNTSVDDAVTVPVELPDDLLDENNDIQEPIIIETPNDEEASLQQTYSTELPNYFSFDVESQTAEADISAELTSIATNIQEQDITEPISFIVTDANNNPVSFNVFAMSAGITLAQEVLSALEEDFELYAYNDQYNGIRFGFIVNAKNADLLQTALLANEATLPEALNPILNGLGVTAVNVVFADSAYKTHPIRYFNLNATETYSVDYTINNMQWVLGTSKNTMRAILDAIKNDVVTNEDIVQ